jgi:ubiquinol-cytochrome c reductase cytochrome b subunit
MTVRTWIESRSSFFSFSKKHLDEPMPPGVGWPQTLGNLLMTLLIFQFVTGIALAMFYAPTPDHAHQSVKYIGEQMAFGSFIRGLHHWGATFIVLVATAHMLRTLFWGSYKKPRELTWVIGVLIFQIILGFSFTGYLLPWDQKAYWATVVGTRIAATVPYIGDQVLTLARGGKDVGALTLTRFYAVHIMLLPAALMMLSFIHLYLVRKHHIAGPVTPRKGRPEPFFPVQLFRDAVVVVVAVGILLGLAHWLPPELGDVANPAGVDFTPRPEWYFLGLYEFLKLIPPQLEVVGTVVVPTMETAGMLLLPWLDRSESRHPAKRGWVMDVAILMILGIGVLTLKGMLSEPPPPPKAPKAVEAMIAAPAPGTAQHP